MNNTLHIVKNGERVFLTTKELFNSNEFDEIKAVTYVASPSFFYKIVDGFKKVDLIIGIEENNHLTKFESGLGKLNVKEQIKFWNDLLPDVKEKVREDHYTIRYAAKGTPVHSKIFLLKGKNKKRVIVGSANISFKAFEGNQFEELLVFDDEDVYNLYEDRYSEILEQTVDYIPERVKRPKNEIEAEQMIIINDNPELLTEIFLSEATKIRDVIVLEQEQFEEILEENKARKKELEEDIKFERVVETVFIKQPGSPHVKIGTPKQLEKKIEKIVTIVAQRSKEKEEIVDERPVWHFKHSDGSILKGQANNNDMIRYGKLATSNEIKESIELIDGFVSAYRDFTEIPNNEVLKKVYESILYGFTSPFIWKMRDHYARSEGRSSVRRHFRPFLIIAGRPYSGKSTILEFVQRMLGINGKINSYTQLKKMIPLLFETNNLAPILVEELNRTFFMTKSNRNVGEDFIKGIANDREGEHPVLLGTTNATDFTISHQAGTRIYFLQIDNAFKSEPEDKVKAEKFLGGIFDKTNDILFRDFVYRFSEKVENGEKFYDVIDMLYLTREIFKEYYSLIEKDVPDFFPFSFFQEEKERGVITWESLFHEYPEAFSTTEQKDTIFVKMDLLPAKNVAQKRDFLQLLPNEVIARDNAGLLILHKELFYQFIGHSEKTEHQNELFDDNNDDFFLNDKTNAPTTDELMSLVFEKLSQEYDIKPKQYENDRKETKETIVDENIEKENSEEGKPKKKGFFSWLFKK